MSFLGLWLAVGVLGGAGALLRLLVSRLVSGVTRGGFPLGTLAVNLSGTILLGVLAGIALSGSGYLLAGTATLGSYTTFSTWMLESEREGEAGRRWVMIANLMLSLALGLAAAWTGRRIGGG